MILWLSAVLILEIIEWRSGEPQKARDHDSSRDELIERMIQLHYPQVNKPLLW